MSLFNIEAAYPAFYSSGISVYSTFGKNRDLEFGFKDLVNGNYVQIAFEDEKVTWINLVTTVELQ